MKCVCILINHKFIISFSLSLVIIYGCVTNHLKRYWLETVSVIFLLRNLLLGQGFWEKTCLCSTCVSWYGSNRLGGSSSTCFTLMPDHLVWAVVWQLNWVALWEPQFLRSKTPRLEASSLFQSDTASFLSYLVAWQWCHKCFPELRRGETEPYLSRNMAIFILPHSEPSHSNQTLKLPLWSFLPFFLSSSPRFSLEIHSWPLNHLCWNYMKFFQ